jgi:hypothetical protein
MEKEKINTLEAIDQPEKNEASAEAKLSAVNTLATEFHEQWRKTRLNEDGSYESRIKSTKDESWIEKNGTDQVDIANTNYIDLPADWQAENKAAAETVVDIIQEKNGQIDLSNDEIYNEVGDKIHSAWMSRNEWAKGGELDVPFAELPEVEKNKDIDQMIVAQKVFSE